MRGVKYLFAVLIIGFSFNFISSVNLTSDNNPAKDETYSITPHYLASDDDSPPPMNSSQS